MNCTRSASPKKLRQVMQKYGIKAMAWALFAEGREEIF